MADPRRTPLADTHIELGGRMVDFAGYLMPVQYTSIINEALAVRSKAGMFDVSHMARLVFSGSSAEAALEHLTSNEIANLEPGQSQYSLLPNEQGGVVDDIIVGRAKDATFKMVVNAANHEKDVAHIKDHLPAGVSLEDLTEETAMIAVQGPEAASIVASLSDNKEAMEAVPMFGMFDGRVAGIACSSSRSGYTGEDGFEIVCQASDAAKLWHALLEAGVVSCGLGARDTLRVEAGLPLYGHELGDDFSPLEAGLGWVISKTKKFLGSDKIAEVREKGPSRKLIGVKLPAKRLIAPEMPLYRGDQQVGAVSSGVVSPHLDCGLGFGFVEPSVKFGEAGAVEIRGKREEIAFQNKRFIKRA